MRNQRRRVGSNEIHTHTFNTLNHETDSRMFASYFMPYLSLVKSMVRKVWKHIVHIDNYSNRSVLTNAAICPVGAGSGLLTQRLRERESEVWLTWAAIWQHTAQL